MAIAMTFLIYDKTKDSPDHFWTTERLKEEFFLCLAGVKERIYNEEGKPVTIRRYYAQARYKMPLIPVGSPSPPFWIYFSDLSPRIQRDFTGYCKVSSERDVTLFLKEVAGRFFENLDFAYYHGSVMKCFAGEIGFRLRWIRMTYSTRILGVLKNNNIRITIIITKLSLD